MVLLVRKCQETPLVALDLKFHSVQSLPMFGWAEPNMKLSNFWGQGGSGLPAQTVIICYENATSQLNSKGVQWSAVDNQKWVKIWPWSTLPFAPSSGPRTSVLTPQKEGKSIHDQTSPQHFTTGFNVFNFSADTAISCYLQLFFKIKLHHHTSPYIPELSHSLGEVP